MYDPSMRVLTVLEILQARGTATTKELAERLEVSERTVQRYVARLQDLGVPVTSTRGRGGAYSLARGFRMQPLMFNTEEALAVALGLKALRELGVTSTLPAVSGVEAKLERVLPEDVWNRMQAISKILDLVEQPWKPLIDFVMIGQLAAAIQAQHEVDIKYVNYQAVASERTIQPYGLVRENNSWFLVAYCLMRQDTRLFRLDRIKEITQRAETFERPKGMDVRAYVESQLMNLPALWRTEVWVGASHETLNYDLIPSRSQVTAEDSGIVLRCNVDNLEQHAAMLLALGQRIEIREPTELVAAFASIAERAQTLALSG
ncbi:WYL domain-containing protein [bacterium]|nr:WYL domain-containing protein [bacterium]